MRPNTATVVIGVLALTNLVLVAGVVAMVVSPSARDGIASRLGVATEVDRERLEGRVFELEGAVGDSGTDDLSARIDDLESRIDDLAVGSGDEAAESVDDVSSRTDDLEEQLFNAESEFESRVSDVEARIEDLCSSLSFELDVFC